MKGMNVLEKLKEISEREVKRRNQATKYLEKITEEIADPLSELLGEEYIYDEVSQGIIWIPILKKEEKYTYNTNLYFRHTEHRGEKDVEEVGFYITFNGLPVWGSPLENMKGRLFWDCVNQICEWVENVLPTLVEEMNKGREHKLSYLKKIAEYMEKEKNRSE